LPDPVQSQHLNTYRPDIDGLRAVAVLSVVLFHAGVPRLNGGFVGVDIFFVISGFLIGAHVYSDIRRQVFTLSDFYRKRVKRILPAMLVVLAFCYFASVLLLSARELKSFGGSSIATVLSVSNIYFWLQSNYFAQAADQNPLLMTWSLGVEEQFYLIFPIIMLIFGRARRKNVLFFTLLFTICSLASCVGATLTHPTATFYLLPTRAWELCFGIILAIYENGRDSVTLYAAQRFANFSSVAGIVAIAISVVFFNSHTPFPGYAAILPVGGAALLLSSPGSWINRTLLSSLPFTAIGQISYSLYLWHWPLLSFAHVISDRPLSVSMGCGIAVLSLFCAWLSYRFIEQPFRKSNLSSRPLLIRYGLVCLLATGPGLLFYFSSGLPKRVPQATAIEAIKIIEGQSCLGADAPVISPICADTQDTRPAIALIGDSHAAAMAPALREIATRSGYKFYEMVKVSCPPLVGVTRVIDTLASERECLEYNAKVLAFLQQDQRVKVVVITGYWAGPEIDRLGYVTADRLHKPTAREQSDQNLARGLESMVSSLHMAKKRVVLIADVPVFTFDPMRRILSNATTARSYLARHLFPTMRAKDGAPFYETYRDQDEHAVAVLKEVAKADPTFVFDPKVNLCSKDRCFFFNGQEPLYFDNQHVGTIGAQRALKGLVIANAAE
jgi:peptidoglycan/LPS O-acetylase OafA/YrhL